jgi:hypothetical protein
MLSFIDKIMWYKIMKTRNPTIGANFLEPPASMPMYAIQSHEAPPFQAVIERDKP